MVTISVEERLAIIQSELELLRVELARKGEEPFVLLEMEDLLKTLANELGGEEKRGNSARIYNQQP